MGNILVCTISDRRMLENMQSRGHSARTLGLLQFEDNPARRELGLSANGAKCESLGNALGQDPPLLEALKARNRKYRPKNNNVRHFQYHLAPSALLSFNRSYLGRWPKAFTFRAFGAVYLSVYRVPTVGRISNGTSTRGLRASPRTDSLTGVGAGRSIWFCSLRSHKLSLALLSGNAFG